MADVIHMLKLLMHFFQYIALFSKPSSVKLSITCFVSRATREVIKLIKLSRIECTKNQKVFIFFVVSLEKYIYKTETFNGVNLVFQFFENILSL